MQLWGKLESLFHVGSNNFTQTGGAFQGSGSERGPESQHKGGVNSPFFVCSDTGGAGKPPAPGLSPVDWRLRRVELPMFNGTDPDGWIFRAERYIALQRFEEKEKVVIAGICMEGEALAWFHWADSRRPVLVWEDLKLQLLNRFRLTDGGSALEQLLALRQTGNLREFRHSFEIHQIEC